jgi:hypothetical protein
LSSQIDRRLQGFLNALDRIDLRKVKAKAAEEEKQRIVEQLLDDAFITTQLSTYQLENVIRVVDGGETSNN